MPALLIRTEEPEQVHELAVHVPDDADRRVELQHHRLLQQDHLALLGHRVDLRLGHAWRALLGAEVQEPINTRVDIELRRHRRGPPSGPGSCPEPVSCW